MYLLFTFLLLTPKLRDLCAWSQFGPAVVNSVILDGFSLSKKIKSAILKAEGSPITSVDQNLAGFLVVVSWCIWDGPRQCSPKHGLNSQAIFRSVPFKLP